MDAKQIPVSGSAASRQWTIMITNLGVLIVVATLLAGCFPRESYPRESTTTTLTCPSGTRLQSDGMCR